MDPTSWPRCSRYIGPVQLTDARPGAHGPTTRCRSCSATSTSLGVADNEQRTDALAEAAQLTFEALLDGSCPIRSRSPATSARSTSERRLLMWSADPEEQALLEPVHMAGRSRPSTAPTGGRSPCPTAAGNKIDSFLERRGRLRRPRPIRHRRDDGHAARRARPTPRRPTGCPTYVIGQPDRRPTGTSRLYVTFYSPLGLDRRHARRRADGLAAAGRRLERLLAVRRHPARGDRRRSSCAGRHRRRTPTRSSRGSSPWRRRWSRRAERKPRLLMGRVRK